MDNEPIRLTIDGHKVEFAGDSCQYLGVSIQRIPCGFRATNHNRLNDRTYRLADFPGFESPNVFVLHPGKTFSFLRVGAASMVAETAPFDAASAKLRNLERRLKEVERWIDRAETYAQEQGELG